MDNQYGVHPHPEEVLSRERLEMFTLRQKLQADRGFVVVLSLDGATVAILNSTGKVILAEDVSSLD